MNPIVTRHPPPDRLRLQSEPRTLGANRSQHWLNLERLRVYSLGAILCYIAFIVIYSYRVLWQHADIMPPAMDMLPFWSASYLALHGHAIDAYNVSVFTRVEVGVVPYFGKIGGIMPWLYPPTFLLVVYPLALLPYLVAVGAFLGGTCIAFVMAIRAILPSRQSVWVALAFPGAALVAVMGQNAFLTAALAGFGLVLLPRRPILAGLCLGLLCVKPHLAVLFPLALLCSRSWRALASFTLTAVLTLAFALLAFGPATFAAFLHNAGMAAGYVEAGGDVLARLPTVFALIKLMKGSVALAYVAQSVSALLAAGAVCHVWGRESSYSLRAATLIGASLLVSPYLHDYDLVWYGLLIAWYCRHCMAYGWKRGEREWLCVLWLAPLAGVFVVTRLQFQFMPLISALTLCMLVCRVNFERRAATVVQQHPAV